MGTGFVVGCVLEVMEDEKSRFRRRCVVRWVLVWASLGWGISLWFTVVPWEVASAGLEEMGAREIRFDPFLDYWMRVIGVVFFMIGMGCFLLAVRLECYAVNVPFVGWFHLVVGVGSLFIAVTMGMSVSVYPTLVAEIVFSVVIGGLLLVYGAELRES